MKQTVNERIILLKTESGLSNLEFCAKAKISNGTLFNIQNGENIQPKTIKVLCEALNLNREWLMQGTGSRHNENSEKNPIDKALELLNEQLKKKDEQISSLMALIGNFPKPLNYTGPLKFVKNLSGELRGKTA